MSNINDGFEICGDVDLVVTDGVTGEIKHKRHINNLVVTTGKNHIASRIAGIFTGEGVAISHIGVGTGVTSPSLTDTILGNEIGSRAAVTLSHTPSTNKTTITGTVTGVTASITELGMFNASVINTGTMVCRTTFSSIPIISSDNIAISWNLTVK